MITKRKNYKLTTSKDDREDEITIDEYIKDVFDSHYSEFLLNFGMEDLMQSLD